MKNITVIDKGKTLNGILFQRNGVLALLPKGKKRVNGWNYRKWIGGKVMEPAWKF